MCLIRIVAYQQPKNSICFVLITSENNSDNIPNLLITSNLRIPND